MLLQLYGGASAILINKRGEAVAMDKIQNVIQSAEIDINFAYSCGIDISQHMYPFKSKVVQFAQLLINWNCKESQPFVDAAPSKPLKELQGLSEKDLDCVICRDREKGDFLR